MQNQKFVGVDCHKNKKNRNNHRGTRILNSVIYSITIVQTRYDKIGSEYYHRKQQEGKSKKVARKHLSRQICNLIWKKLFTD